MAGILTEDLIYEILSVVEEIPAARLHPTDRSRS